MRVLFISSLDPFKTETGPARHLQGLSKALTKLGCEVYVLVLNGRTSPRSINGVQVNYLCTSHIFLKIPIVGHYVLPLISFQKIEKLYREYKFEIIHGQSPSSWGYGLLCRNDIPFVVTLHSTSFGEFASHFDAPLSFVNKDFILDAAKQILTAPTTCIEYRCANKVIAVSKALAREAVKFFRLPRNRVVAIHNGIDLPRISFSRFKKENEEHLILSVGRLVWRKGYKYLFDAMPHVLSEYPDAKLIVVGYGNQKISLQRYAKKLGIDGFVHFLDKVSRETLYSLYRKAEVYVQPSLYEPFGITILEAMSMRKPVVATNVGGIPEIITNGVEGLLVEPGNSLQLAKAITSVFSDSSLMRRLGNNARRRVERDFTWETIAKKTLELYKQVLCKF